MALSFLLSGCLLAWSFSLPFRQSQSKLSFGKTTAAEDLATLAAEKRSQAEEFREAAIKLDREFMRTYRHQREATRRSSRPISSRQKWDRHVDSVRRQMALLGEPKRGTIEWQEKQLLQESLQDGPR